jgi:hypothetical protein
MTIDQERANSLSCNEYAGILIKSIILQSLQTAVRVSMTGTCTKYVCCSASIDIPFVLCAMNVINDYCVN